MSLKDFELHLTDPRDIIARWGRELPEAITNTKQIADRCTVDIELGKILIPKYPLPEGETSEHSYLHKLVYRGLAQRYNGAKPEDIADQLPEQIIPTWLIVCVSGPRWSWALWQAWGMRGIS